LVPQKRVKQVKLLTRGGVNTTGYESGLSGEDYYGDLSKLSRAEQGITQIVPQTIVGSGAGAGTAKTGTAAAAKTAAGGTKILGMDASYLAAFAWE
jgi:hypothetical protein